MSTKKNAVSGQYHVSGFQVQIGGWEFIRAWAFIRMFRVFSMVLNALTTI